MIAVDGLPERWGGGRLMTTAGCWQREMAEQAWRERLREIDMSSHEASLYEGLYTAVAKEVRGTKPCPIPSPAQTRAKEPSTKFKPNAASPTCPAHTAPRKHGGRLHRPSALCTSRR